MLLHFSLLHSTLTQMDNEHRSGKQGEAAWHFLRSTGVSPHKRMFSPLTLHNNLTQRIGYISHAAKGTRRNDSFTQ